MGSGSEPTFESRRRTLGEPMNATGDNLVDQWLNVFDKTVSRTSGFPPLSPSTVEAGTS